MILLNIDKEELRVLWAIAEAKALDAEAGDHDDGLTEKDFRGRKSALLREMPTARQLRTIANALKEKLLA